MSEPDTFTPERAANLVRWKLNRDFTAGITAVKGARETYLPRRASHVEDADYEEYLISTEMFPAAARTLQSHVGLVFRKKYQLDAPAAFDNFKLVTADGKSLLQAAKWAFREYLTVNDGGILIDRATADTPMTKGQARLLDLRPYMGFYPGENIRELTSGVVGGAKKLVRVRLLDDVDTVRELELIDGAYTVTIHKRTNGKWTVATVTQPLRNGAVMDHIPFFALTDDDEGAAFDDLCQTNWTHYAHAARHNIAQLWMSRPQPYVTGVKQDVSLPMCEGLLWRLEDATAKAEYLDFKGDGVPSLERTLERLEKHLAMLGSRMLESEKAAAEAAETVARRQASENSILASGAHHVSERFQDALREMAAWAGIAGDITFKLSTDFIPTPIDPQLIAQIISLVQNDLMTKEEAFDALQRGELISEEIDYETHQTAIEAQVIDQPVTNGPIQ